MNKIEFIRGDTQILNLEIHDASGLIYKLKPTDKLVFTVKNSVYDMDVIIQKIFDDTMTIRIEHSDTTSLEFGEYQYDIQLTQEDGTVTTIIPPSPFILKEEVNYD